jgi:hypothetical protein
MEKIMGLSMEEFKSIVLEKGLPKKITGEVYGQRRIRWDPTEFPNGIRKLVIQEELSRGELYRIKEGLMNYKNKIDLMTFGAIRSSKVYQSINKAYNKINEKIIELGGRV